MGNATLAIDGHVHLYEVYDLKTAVVKGIENLTNSVRSNGSSVIPIWLLVERSDANFFDQIYQSPERFSDDGIRFVPCQDRLTILVQRDNHRLLYIFAGRQLVTREGLELLSLISNYSIADRSMTMDELIEAVKAADAIPALNWAPGKWFFKRGKEIARQLHQRSKDELFIGETTLRLNLWPEPKLIRVARQKGFPIIAGSDPLPFPGEEVGIGSFGFTIEGEFDHDQPARSLKQIMKKNRPTIQIIGRRNDIFTFTRRQFKIMNEKRTRQ